MRNWEMKQIPFETAKQFNLYEVWIPLLRLHSDGKKRINKKFEEIEVLKMYQLSILHRKLTH